MTIEQVIETRDRLKSLTFEAKKEGGSVVTCYTPIHVYCNSNLSYYTDWNDGSFIWDDAKAIFTVFSYNSNNNMAGITEAVSTGDRPVAPVYVASTAYTDIISMRAVLIEDTFYKLVESLGLSGDDVKNLYHKFFVETDQSYVIPRKNKIGYSSQASKNFMKDKYYDDRAAYLKTVHAVPL